MVRYIGKRLLMMIPVLLGIVLIVFCMNHISSGNPARMLLGVGASDEAIAALEEELGLNDPLYVQFFNYVKGVVTEFDLGTSYQTKRPVIDELMERFVRGDDSRNTEGSGLGLNIAKTLMELQKGQLQLLVDGDLFKVTLIFPGATE